MGICAVLALVIFRVATVDLHQALLTHQYINTHTRVKTQGQRVLARPRSRRDTYLLTPWCRVLLEQLTCLKQVKKFPAFHGTQRFINALTSVHHLSLS
jgi:hypothetical protein